MVAYIVLVERRVVARSCRTVSGPNRGRVRLDWLQPAADGIKAFLKEEFTPGARAPKFISFWRRPLP